MRRILLVDGNAVFRLGLAEVVKAITPALLVYEADTFSKARIALQENDNIALIILDIGIPDCGGFVGLNQLRREFPDIPVIVLSGSSNTEHMNRAVAAGVAGFIRKSAPCSTILQTLRTTLSGQGNIMTTVADPERPNPLKSLSPALLRVLMGVQQGLRNKEIAYELGLTEKTIKAYLGLLYRKLGVNNRTQAVILMQKIMSDSHTPTVLSEISSNP